MGKKLRLASLNPNLIKVFEKKKKCSRLDSVLPTNDVIDTRVRNFFQNSTVSKDRFSCILLRFFVIFDMDICTPQLSFSRVTTLPE